MDDAERTKTGGEGPSGERKTFIFGTTGAVPRSRRGATRARALHDAEPTFATLLVAGRSRPRWSPSAVDIEDAVRRAKRFEFLGRREKCEVNHSHVLRRAFHFFLAFVSDASS
jgi:hypothetical protein